MFASTSLLQFLLTLVAGWLQRQQAAAIEYLQAENCMLRHRLVPVAHRVRFFITFGRIGDRWKVAPDLAAVYAGNEFRLTEAKIECPVDRFHALLQCASMALQDNPFAPFLFMRNRAI